MGALWSFIGPLITFVILYFIFVERFGKQIDFFPLKLLTGIILIKFFNSVIQICMTAVSQCRNITLNSLTPSEIHILSPMIVPIIKLGVELSLCVGIALCLGLFRLLHLPMILIAMALFLMLSVGIGLFLASLNSLAHDVGEIWSALAPLLFFLSPIFYSFNMLSPWAQTILYWMNPLSSYILCFQYLIVGQPIPLFSHGTLLQIIVYAFVALSIGYLFFKKLEKQILERT